MGKKDKKNKNKISGAEKTTLKTEKKLDAKQKKKLAALGEVRQNIICSSINVLKLLFCGNYSIFIQLDLITSTFFYKSSNIVG